MTYFMANHIKTNASFVSTLPKSIFYKLTAKKRWTLTNIVYFRVETTWRKHKDPITGYSYIACRYGKCQKFQAFQELMKLSFCVDHKKRTSDKSCRRPWVNGTFLNSCLHDFTLSNSTPRQFEIGSPWFDSKLKMERKSEWFIWSISPFS